MSQGSRGGTIRAFVAFFFPSEIQVVKNLQRPPPKELLQMKPRLGNCYFPNVLILEILERTTKPAGKNFENIQYGVY